MNTDTTFTMPAGKYYVGDLCYVMHGERWTMFCDATCQKDGTMLNGKFFVDGVNVVFFNTLYGDGEYADNNGRMYPVDAGLIGVIAFEDIDHGNPENSTRWGHVIEFPEAFECLDGGDGQLVFGKIVIETGDVEEEEEDDEYEEEDEY